MYWFVSPAQASSRTSASEAGRDPHERDRGRSTEFTQVLGRRYVFRCSGPFASPTFSGGSCAGRTSLPLPPVARFATSGGAAVDGPPRPFFVAAVHLRAALAPVGCWRERLRLTARDETRARAAGRA